MPGKQTSEQGFRRVPSRMGGNYNMGRMQNKKSWFHGQGHWNQKNDQCKRIKKRGLEFDQNIQGSQPLSKINGA